MNARVAIVGSGIAGLSAAHHLHGHAAISLFEAGDYFGGHTHTVDITLAGANGHVSYGVDTGFLVYNERTYPGLIDLFEQLGIQTAQSDMSFSVQAPWGNSGRTLEWNGADLNSVFAQRSNLLRPKFWWLLREIIRFNQLCTQLAQSYDDGGLMQPLQNFLDSHGFGATFKDNYLLPMLGCIWSCPTAHMLQFPAATMVRFCDNHGLLQVNNRPQWFTVQGGLRLLAQASAEEHSVLSNIGFQDNLAVLHTDASVMPRQRLAWAAWNYQRSADHSNGASVCLHYWLNKLQPLPFTQDVFVSLNPDRPIAPEHVLGRFKYSHPVFDLAAIQAQRQLGRLQGRQHTWFAGAWMGYGFHEDGFKAGRAAAQGILQELMAEEPA